MAILELGQRRERMTVRLETDDDFVDTIRLEAGPKNVDGLPEGTPIDWPAGTQAWLELRTHGTETWHRWDAEVTGPYLTWDVDTERVDVIGRKARARLWIAYPADVTDVDPFIFAKGEVVWDEH